MACQDLVVGLQDQGVLMVYENNGTHFIVNSNSTAFAQIPTVSDPRPSFADIDNGEVLTQYPLLLPKE